MATATPLLGLPVPELTDAADITGAVTPLAAKIESDLIHVGDLKATARSSAPTGWLLCDGAAVSRATYVNLWNAIRDGHAGTGGDPAPYGNGNGTTTFNVPDLRARVPVGVDGVAGRLAANDAIGAASGAATQALSVADLPSHAHGGSTQYMGGGNPHQHPMTQNPHTHGTGVSAGYWLVPGVYGNSGAGGFFVSGTGSTAVVYWRVGNVDGASIEVNNSVVDINHVHGVNAEGSNGSHNNMPPYQVVNWLIKF